MDNSPTRILLTRPDQLKALADDRRRRILQLLGECPQSVSGLARALGLPRGTVGYHVKLLERAGLIRLASTAQRRGFVEKSYERTADLFAIQSHGAEPDDLSAVAATGLREAADEVRLGEDRAASTFGVVHARMSRPKAAEFITRLNALLAEFGEADHDDEEAVFGLAAALWERPS